eukprot:366130-Chlamydomonas_euryale.AAC.10
MSRQPRAASMRLALKPTGPPPTTTTLSLAPAAPCIPASATGDADARRSCSTWRRGGCRSAATRGDPTRGPQLCMAATATARCPAGSKEQVA